MVKVDTKLKDGGFMEVRIEDGLIDEIFYQGSTESKTLSRKETDDMKAWLKDILKADVKKFKEILLNIKEDKEFFEYGKDELLGVRMQRYEKLLDYRRKCRDEIERLQKEVEECDLLL